MSHLKQRINAFAKLGDFFLKYCECANNDTQSADNERPWFKRFDDVVELAGHKNGWFTKENILFSLHSWGKLLNQESLEDWLTPYTIKVENPKVVAIIMAGNIPLVGFHDFMAVLVTGNTALIKLSSNDSVLLPFIADYLAELETSLRDKIIFTDGLLKDFDAIIATGSNNTARYFEHYFGKGPNIIRKNRNSVAVLTGYESFEKLHALGEDIFRYYGLGCRSVSKIFVPVGYDFELFFKSINSYSFIMDKVKYSNNYDYNKAVYLMSEFAILDNGFLILKNDVNYGSPIASLFYEEYGDLEKLKLRLGNDADQIQCIIGEDVAESEIPFGSSQTPSLKDYADGIDSVEFLLKI